MSLLEIVFFIKMRKELQRSSQSEVGYSFVTRFNGHEILDLTEKGNDIIVSTSYGKYIRKSSGNVESWK